MSQPTVAIPTEEEASMGAPKAFTEAVLRVEKSQKEGDPKVIDVPTALAEGLITIDSLPPHVRVLVEKKGGAPEQGPTQKDSPAVEVRGDPPKEPLEKETIDSPAETGSDSPVKVPDEEPTAKKSSPPDASAVGDAQPAVPGAADQVPVPIDLDDVVVAEDLAPKPTVLESFGLAGSRLRIQTVDLAKSGVTDSPPRTRLSFEDDDEYAQLVERYILSYYEPFVLEDTSKRSTEEPNVDVSGLFPPTDERTNSFLASLPMYNVVPVDTDSGLGHNWNHVRETGSVVRMRASRLTRLLTGARLAEFFTLRGTDAYRYVELLDQRVRARVKSSWTETRGKRLYHVEDGIVNPFVYRPALPGGAGPNHNQADFLRRAGGGGGYAVNGFDAYITNHTDDRYRQYPTFVAWNEDGNAPTPSVNVELIYGPLRELPHMPRMTAVTMKLALTASSAEVASAVNSLLRLIICGRYSRPMIDLDFDAATEDGSTMFILLALALFVPQACVYNYDVMIYAISRWAGLPFQTQADAVAGLYGAVAHQAGDAPGGVPLFPAIADFRKYVAVRNFIDAVRAYNLQHIGLRNYETRGIGGRRQIYLHDEAFAALTTARAAAIDPGAADPTTFTAQVRRIGQGVGALVNQMMTVLSAVFGNVRANTASAPLVFGKKLGASVLAFNAAALETIVSGGPEGDLLNPLTLVHGHTLNWEKTLVPISAAGLAGALRMHASWPAVRIEQLEGEVESVHIMPGMGVADGARKIAAASIPMLFNETLLVTSDVYRYVTGALQFSRTPTFGALDETKRIVPIVMARYLELPNGFGRFLDTFCEYILYGRGTRAIVGFNTAITTDAYRASPYWSVVTSPYTNVRFDYTYFIKFNDTHSRANIERAPPVIRFRKIADAVQGEPTNEGPLLFRPDCSNLDRLQFTHGIEWGENGGAGVDTIFAFPLIPETFEPAHRGTYYGRSQIIPLPLGQHRSGSVPAFATPLISIRANTDKHLGNGANPVGGPGQTVLQNDAGMMCSWFYGAPVRPMHYAAREGSATPRIAYASVGRFQLPAVTGAISAGHFLNFYDFVLRSHAIPVQGIGLQSEEDPHRIRADGVEVVLDEDRLPDTLTFDTDDDARPVLVGVMRAIRAQPLQRVPDHLRELARMMERDLAVADASMRLGNIQPSDAPLSREHLAYFIDERVTSVETESVSAELPYPDMASPENYNSAEASITIKLALQSRRKVVSGVAPRHIGAELPSAGMAGLSGEPASDAGPLRVGMYDALTVGPRLLAPGVTVNRHPPVVLYRHGDGNVNPEAPIEDLPVQQHLDDVPAGPLFTWFDEHTGRFGRPRNSMFTRRFDVLIRGGADQYADVIERDTALTPYYQCAGFNGTVAGGITAAAPAADLGGDRYGLSFTEDFLLLAARDEVEWFHQLRAAGDQQLYVFDDGAEVRADPGAAMYEAIPVTPARHAHNSWTSNAALGGSDVLETAVPIAFLHRNQLVSQPEALNVVGERPLGIRF